MAKRRGITIEDLYRFQFVADARISPDGESVLFVLSKCHPDRKRDTYESHIWRVKAGGGPAARFTNSSESESSPQWSPDGKRVLFLSARDAEDEQKGKTQLWMIPADGGEAVRITNRKHGVSSPRWSPDGKSVLVAARVPLGPKQDALPEDRQSDVIHINRLSYRMNGAGYHHAFRAHLFVINSKGGRPRQITKGDWSPESAAWSIDGSRIYCTGNREEDADHTYARNLYSISAATGRIKHLCGLKGGLSSPAPSPDGTRIAFVGSTLKRSLGTNSHAYVVPASGGVPRNVSGHLDVSVGTSVNSDARTASPGLGLVWSPDGRQIRFLASVRGADRLFGLDVASGDMACYTEGERTIESVSYSTDHTVSAYTQMTPTRLAEVWLWRAGGKEKRLTRFNDALLRGPSLVEPDRFEFRASDGAQVEGWTMLPEGPARGKRPGILQIHGGPRTAYGLGFMHEFQVLCAAGFAVSYINPRGSSSYGEDWACAVGRHYGERDYEDIMEAADVVLRRYPISSRNLGVTGGSYGGFMTNWIVGHTNRFKAACTQRSICNWVSFFGTSDIGWRFAPEEVGGLPWRNLDTYWKKSPLAYVEKVETPLLIIHSDEDWRCPVEQAGQLFVALKSLGKEAEFIRFPGESHELSRSGKPSHRAERLDAIVDWFSDRLQPRATRPRPGRRRRRQ